MEKKRIATGLIIVLAVVAAAIPPGFMTSDSLTSPGGYLEERDGLQILHLSGDARTMGQQQGTLLRDEVRAFLRQVELQPSDVLFWLRARARRLDDSLPRDLREELLGIAEGAGIPYSDVLLLAVYPESMIQPPSVDVAREWASVRPFIPPSEYFPLPPDFTAEHAKNAEKSLESSANSAFSAVKLVSPERLRGLVFAAWGHASDGGHLVEGSAWDLPLHLIVVIREPRVGDKHVALSWIGSAGVLGGINEEQVSVLWTPAPSSDIAADGLTASLAAREALQQAGNIATAIEVIASARRAGGAVFLVGDGKPPEAVVVEASAHRYAEFRYKEGWVLRGGGYLDQVLAETQRGIAVPSLSNLRELERSIRARYGSVSEGDVVDLLHEAGAGWGVIVVPSEGAMWVLGESGPAVWAGLRGEPRILVSPP